MSRWFYCRAEKRFYITDDDEVYMDDFGCAVFRIDPNPYDVYYLEDDNIIEIQIPDEDSSDPDDTISINVVELTSSMILEVYLKFGENMKRHARMSWDYSPSKCISRTGTI